MKKYKEKKSIGMRVMDWPLEDRPMGKIITKGSDHLSNAELMACLIGTGTENHNVMDVSRMVMASVDNDMNAIGSLTLTSLMNIPGIGEKKAAVILAAIELGRRRSFTNVRTKQSIRNSKDIYDIFKPFMYDLEHEEMWIVLMNVRHEVIDTVKVSQGGIDSTVVDPKIIFIKALEKRASSIAMIHNHPSGSKIPSNSDNQITKKVKEACSFMDIQFLDHIVFAKEGYYSFADEGVL